MISTLSNQEVQYHSPLRFSFSEVNQKVQKIAYESFWIPLSTGAQVAVYDLVLGLTLGSFLSAIPNVENFLADPAIADEYTEMVQMSFWDTAIKAPLIEEVVFRFVIQNTFKWIANAILPDQNIEIFSHPMKLATLVAVVATAVLFGSAHLGSGLGIIHFILATISGITYGILKENFGLRSSIAAHVTNNAICYGIMSLS